MQHRQPPQYPPHGQHPHGQHPYPQPPHGHAHGHPYQPHAPHPPYPPHLPQRAKSPAWLTCLIIVACAFAMMAVCVSFVAMNPLPPIDNGELDRRAAQDETPVDNPAEVEAEPERDSELEDEARRVIRGGVALAIRSHSRIKSHESSATAFTNPYIPNEMVVTLRFRGNVDEQYAKVAAVDLARRLRDNSKEMEGRWVVWVTAYFYESSHGHPMERQGMATYADDEGLVWATPDGETLIEGIE